MEKDKTVLQNFEELYPTQKIADNPLLMAEAVGYLKGIEEYNPTLKDEIRQLKVALMCAMAFKMI